MRARARRVRRAAPQCRTPWDGRLSIAVIDVGGFLGIGRHGVAIPVDVQCGHQLRSGRCACGTLTTVQDIDREQHKGSALLQYPSLPEIGNRFTRPRSARFGRVSMATMSERDLLRRDAKRHIGEELLRAVREMKAGKAARVRRVRMSAIAEARSRVGLSQTQFAEVLGVSTRTNAAGVGARKAPAIWRRTRLARDRRQEA